MSSADTAGWKCPADAVISPLTADRCSKCMWFKELSADQQWLCIYCEKYTSSDSKKCEHTGCGRGGAW